MNTGQIVVAVIGSTGLWEFVKWLIGILIKKFGKKKKNLDLQQAQDHKTIELLSEASRATLHDRLYYLCTIYIKDGSISAADYENLQEMYQPYRAMGGNGTVHKLMGQIEQMNLSEKY